MTDSGINILATRFYVVVTYIAWFGKTLKDLTFRDNRLSAATCVCHIELYLMHVQVKG